MFCHVVVDEGGGRDVSVDLLHCQPYFRIGIGEHIFHGSALGRFHFAFGVGLDVEVDGEKPVALESLLDVDCCCADSEGVEVLIPTTRGSHYRMPLAEWARRGAPQGTGVALSVTRCGQFQFADGGKAGLCLSWVDDELGLQGSSDCETVQVSLSRVVYAGSVELR